MTRSLDMSGLVFGAWTVKSSAGHSSGKAKIALWKCRCACGVESVVYGTALRSGKSTGCSACARPKIAASRQTHGMSLREPTYVSWRSMKARCLNANAPDYPQYGGRGIKVCERWLDFENFVEDMGVRPTGMTLDRKDGNGNYEPSNCRWATSTDQANNRRSNSNIVWKGESMTLSEFGRRAGIDRRRVRYCIAVKGMSPDEVITVTKESGYGQVAGATRK